MRKITKESVSAFLARRTFSKGNMSCDGTELKLHGNTIAKHEGNKVYATLAGWNTVTTRERLNGLTGCLFDSGRVADRVSFVQRKGLPYLYNHTHDMLIEIDDNEWCQMSA